MSSLHEIAKLCIYAVVIITCIKMIRGEDLYIIEDIVPNIENNAYIARIQGESIVNMIVDYLNQVYETLTAPSMLTSTLQSE